MHAYRSHTCAALTAANVGETVRLSGWVHRVRDHGGVLFIDLRDHFGVTQVLCDGDSAAFAELERAYELRSLRLLGLRRDPHWQPLHDDPRYKDLLRRIGFPEV